MKNSVQDRSNALPSCAGLFIGGHLTSEFPGTWIHIDMAYPAFLGERATGYGVALLNTIFCHLSSSPLLHSLLPSPRSVDRGDSLLPSPRSVDRGDSLLPSPRSVDRGDSLSPSLAKKPRDALS
ncbi:unnamed protein product [Cyprideis torosa]|uniref:Uncharacterized protein n=1 Tax=Cyprideis torosa TaxID=163714 RepID=A0A7R8WPR9_9CRUS|nr:unnamed protein product [Cyprideis torosa]CAG0907442.1 unnamed protein product [Cyprideis torosa]